MGAPSYRIAEGMNSRFTGSDETREFRIKVVGVIIGDKKATQEAENQALYSNADNTDSPYLRYD